GAAGLRRAGRVAQWPASGDFTECHAKDGGSSRAEKSGARKAARRATGDRRRSGVPGAAGVSVGGRPHRQGRSLVTILVCGRESALISELKIGNSLTLVVADIRCS